MKLNYAVLLMLFMMSCQLAEDQTMNAPQSPFMDIKGYFEKEMTKEITNVTKETKFKSEVEKINVTQLDLEKDLTIFAQADISKVAWFEKYKIDTTASNGGTNIKYTAQAEKLKTRYIHIYKHGNQIDSINIHNKMESMIMDTDQYLHYAPQKGYRININQVGKLQEVGELEIKVTY